jgi:hypothetical protein
MGDLNQREFLSRFLSQLNGPVLEVGSRDYGSTQNLRPLFTGKGEYLGVDLTDGPGVDCRLDLTSDFAVIERTLLRKRFGTILCFSVLEHCAQPFRMAENLTRLLQPGGAICISAPFAWKYHAYPADYWRFTHEGIKQLFPGIEFDEAARCSSTSKPGEYLPLDDNVGKRALSYNAHRNPWRAVTASALRILGKSGPLSWITPYRYLLAPTNIHMIGYRRNDSANQAA